MSSMGDAIEQALTTFLSELFVAMVKSVLEESIGACEVQDAEHEGKENLNDMFEDSPNNTTQQDPILGIMAGLGIGLSEEGAEAAKLNPSSDAARGAVSPDVRAKVVDMLDDVSLMFTPIELCSLINGKASNRILLLARNFISRQYPEMNMTSRTKVSDFFRAFGNLIDPSICMVIESPLTDAQSPILGDVLCSTDDVADLRRQILRNKGDDITDDQIETQLAQARQRKVNAAKVLADMVNNGPLSDDYVPPPIVCQKGAKPNYQAQPGEQGAQVTPNSGTQAGLIDLTHESIDFAVDKAVDCLFTPLEISFTSELKDYPSAFITEADEEEVKTVDFYIDDGDSVLNPIIQAKFGDESTARAALGDGNIREGTVDIKSRVRKSMPVLYNFLTNIETNNLIEYKYFSADDPVFNIDDYSVEGVAQEGGVDSSFDTSFGGFGVSIEMPNMAEAQIRDLESAMSGGNADDIPSEVTELIEALRSSASMSLCYILPSVLETEAQSGETHDNRFLTAVMRGDEILYRNYSVHELPEDISAYLDQFTDIVLSNAVLEVAKSPTAMQTVSDSLTGQALYSTPADSVSASAEDFSIQPMLELGAPLAPVSSETSQVVTTQFDTIIAEATSACTPIYRFASLVDSRWADVVDLGSRSFASQVVAEGGIFDNLTTDMFAYVGQKIAMSPYFKTIQVENPSSGDESITTSIPAIEFLQLSPEPTGQQQLDGKDTHPLAMKTKRQCMKENIKNGGCVDVTKPTDGSPAEELSNPEKEMMKLCVESTFRTYMIEHFLRSIFSNSVFKMPSVPDDAYKNYITGHILQSLREYDTPISVTNDSGERKPLTEKGTYEEDFIEQVISMYNVEESQEPNLEEGQSDMDRLFARDENI